MIKVKFGKEIHILKNEGGISGLASAAKKVFKELPFRFHFVYRDEDDDEITVDCQEDFEVFLSETNQGPQGKAKVLKLQIKEEIQLLASQEQVYSSSPMDGGIELLNDAASHSSIQVLHQRDQFEVFSQYSLPQNGDQMAYSSICSEYSQIKDSEITEIVKQNLQKMQNKLIESALAQESAQIQRIQIDGYIRNLYGELQENPQEQGLEEQEGDRNKDTEAYMEEMSHLVQASLNKMLPRFFQRVTAAAINNVKRMIQHEPLFSIPALPVTRA